MLCLPGFGFKHIFNCERLKAIHLQFFGSKKTPPLNADQCAVLKELAADKAFRVAAFFFDKEQYLLNCGGPTRMEQGSFVESSRVPPLLTDDARQETFLQDCVPAGCSQQLTELLALVIRVKQSFSDDEDAITGKVCVVTCVYDMNNARVSLCLLKWYGPPLQVVAKKSEAKGIDRDGFRDRVGLQAGFRSTVITLHSQLNVNEDDPGDDYVDDLGGGETPIVETSGGGAQSGGGLSDIAMSFAQGGSWRIPRRTWHAYAEPPGRPPPLRSQPPANVGTARGLTSAQVGFL